MAADLNKPVSDDLYSSILSDIRDMQLAIAKMNHSATLNLPAGVLQWSDANSRYEKWNGSAWVALMPNATTLQRGLALLSNDSNSSSTTLGATPAAVKNVRDLVTGLQFSSIGGSLSDSQKGRLAQQAGCIRAGNVQMISGTANASFRSTFSAENLSTYTWHLIAPTVVGSNETWTTLDNIPVSARILIVQVELDFTCTSSANSVYISLSTVSGNSAPGNQIPLTILHKVIQDMESGDQHIEQFQCFIPISATKEFQLRLEKNSNLTLSDLKLSCVGFICD